jgi:hypothetical protein
MMSIPNTITVETIMRIAMRIIRKIAARIVGRIIHRIASRVASRIGIMHAHERPVKRYGNMTWGKMAFSYIPCL